MQPNVHSFLGSSCQENYVLNKKEIKTPLGYNVSKYFIAYLYVRWGMGSPRGANNDGISIFFEIASNHGTGGIRMLEQAPKSPFWGDFWG